MEAAVICRASGARLSTQHFLGNLRIGSSQRAVTPALVVAYAAWRLRLRAVVPAMPEVDEF